VMDSGAYTNDYARGYAIYASLDGTNWGTALATGTGTSSVIDVSFPATTAKYLKIVQTGSSANYWSITDLHVYHSDWSYEPPKKDFYANTNWTATGYKASGAQVTGSEAGASAIDDSPTPNITVQCPLTIDNYLDSQMTTTNNGASGLVDAGTARFSTLFKFDMSTCVPQGKTITAATLKVKVYDVSTGAFAFYPLNRTWSESSSTWNNSSSGTPW